jgi:5-formyltetrahydrofolate cyclo-ligase
MAVRGIGTFGVGIVHTITAISSTSSPGGGEAATDTLKGVTDNAAMAAKSALRARVLAARRAVPPDVHDAEAHALAGHLEQLAEGARTVCAYLPVGDEPGSAAMLDRLGTRLGRGAGFYDRSLLLRRAQIPLVAVVRDDELLEMLPAEPHDVPMTHALTPEKGLAVLECRQ